MGTNHGQTLTGIALSIALIGNTSAVHANDDNEKRMHAKTTTPIEHVIVIIGENHTFDNLFGAYRPAPGQTIANLLSKGIIKADGTPGPHFNRAGKN